jgi:hypothetical protein
MKTNEEDLYHEDKYTGLFFFNEIRSSSLSNSFVKRCRSVVFDILNKNELIIYDQQIKG